MMAKVKNSRRGSETQSKTLASLLMLFSGAINEARPRAA